MDILEKHYQGYDEDSRLIKDNAHKIEFITTTKVLNEKIMENSNILEVGAGTGRYSFYYLEQGHKVTAVEKVPKHVDILRSKKKEMKNKSDINIKKGDARDLSDFTENSFDVVLCLGPIYHLRELKDRKKVISECLRVLTPEGILAVAYINRYAQFITHINRDKDYINDEQMCNLLESGKTFYGDDSDCFYFATSREIEGFMEQYKVEKLDHVGTDGIVNMMRDKINAMSDKEFEKWLDYHFQTCRNQRILDYSRHELYICKKI